MPVEINGGRMVFTFYDLCLNLWGGSPAVASLPFIWIGHFWPKWRCRIKRWTIIHHFVEAPFLSNWFSNNFVFHFVIDFYSCEIILFQQTHIFFYETSLIFNMFRKQNMLWNIRFIKMLGFDKKYCKNIMIYLEKM